MSSKRRNKASRANGAKSHGPVTPAGLAKSSMNAVRFGLFAKTIVLTNESQHKFAELGHHYFDKFQPTDGVEHDLVSEMVAAKWRQQRCWLLETAVLDLAMDAQQDELAKTFTQLDEPTRMALAHKDSMPQLASIQRAENSCRRQYERALRNLLLLRQSPPQPDSILQNEPIAPIEPGPISRNQADQSGPCSPLNACDEGSAEAEGPRDNPSQPKLSSYTAARPGFPATLTRLNTNEFALN